jgi:two-component system sensor kinase FixL
VTRMSTRLLDGFAPLPSASADARGWRDATLIVCAFLVLYVLTDWATYIYPVLPLGITPWNPPPGLSLFLLLTFGLRFWPALFVAGVLADIVVRGVPDQLTPMLAADAGVTACYSFAAYLLLRRIGLKPLLDAPRDLAVFLMVIVPTTLVVAMLYVGLYTAFEAVPASDLLRNVAKYWIGDLDGILVLTPMLLCQRGALPPRRAWRRGAGPEIVAQLAAIGAALWLLRALARYDEFRFFYVQFLPLIWIAARWGLRGATLALALIQLGLILIVQIGAYDASTFVQLQFVMLALCLTGLVLGSAISNRGKLDAALQQKQTELNRALQFASAGELTTALAHELNQPMSALNAYLGACQMLAGSADLRQLHDTLAKAVAEARRASEVLRRLRDFYRSGTTSATEASAFAIVANAVQSVKNRADQHGIAIGVHAARPLPPIHVDAIQIENVVQNLINNSIDSLAERPGRRAIAVAVERDGARVTIAVEDSGPGIPESVSPRLFEPFTTTKAYGMGMGLAIVRSLTEANGGEVTLQSSTLGGARFVLAFPVATP